MIGILQRRSDEMCVIRIGQIVGTAHMVDGSLSTVATTAGGGGGGAPCWGGPVGPAIAAGVAGIASGVRGNLDSIVWQNNVSPLIAKTIIDTRDKRWNEIVSGMSKGVNEYPPSAAFAQLVERHNLCTFSSAIAELTATATKIANSGVTVEQRVAALRGEIDKNRELSKDTTLPAAMRRELDDNTTDLMRRIKALNGLVTDPSPAIGK